MARKNREPLTEAPPPADSSSSGEDSGDNSDEETHSSSSSDKTPSPVPIKPPNPKNTKPLNPNPKPKPKPKPSESTESDSSDSAFIKPGSSKPRSRKRVPPQPEKSPSKKTKPADKSEEGPTITKKAKAEEGPAITNKAKNGDKAEEEGKKVLFQRVWSEEDELVILKGMIEYKNKKGKDPMADPDELFEFVKKGLSFGDANKGQFVNKVQRMKKKFENPKRRKFNNPHDVKAFELSKQVWGISDGAEDHDNNNNHAKGGKGSTSKLEVASKGGEVNNGLVVVGKKVESEKKKDNDEVANWVLSRCDRETPALGGIGSSIGLSSEGIFKEGFKLLSEEDKGELNGKWRKHSVEEMEVYLKRVDLIRELTEKSLKALKSAQ